MSSHRWLYFHSDLSTIISERKLIGMVSIRSVAISIETTFNDHQIRETLYSIRSPKDRSKCLINQARGPCWQDIGLRSWENGPGAKKDREGGDIFFFQYDTEQPRLIRDLIHDGKKLRNKGYDHGLEKRAILNGS